MWRISGLLSRALNRIPAANVQGCVHGEAEALNPTTLIPLGQNANNRGYSSQSSGPHSSQNGQEQKKGGAYGFCAGQMPQCRILDAVGVGAAAVFFLQLAQQVSFHYYTSTSHRRSQRTYLEQILSSLAKCNHLSVRNRILPGEVKPGSWKDLRLQADSTLQGADTFFENSSVAASGGSNRLHHVAEQGEPQYEIAPDIGSSYGSDFSTEESASRPVHKVLEPKDEVGESLQSAASRLLDVTESSFPTVLNIFGIVSSRDNADYTTAFRFFRESAETGYSKAQYNTAVCYEKGRGVAKNMTKAAEYYLLAARGGHQQAKYRYACHLLRSKPEDTLSALQMLQEAAQAGMKEAQAYLGVWYSKESHFDPQKAVRYFWMAAENGDVQSRYHLGVCYERGFGVPPSRQEALKHYERAAKSGHEPAQQKVQEILQHPAKVLSSPLASFRAAASSPCLPVLDRTNIRTKTNNTTYSADSTTTLGLPHSMSTGDLLFKSPTDSGSYLLAPVHMTGMPTMLTSLRAIGVG